MNELNENFTFEDSDKLNIAITFFWGKYEWRKAADEPLNPTISVLVCKGEEEGAIFHFR